MRKSVVKSCLDSKSGGAKRSFEDAKDHSAVDSSNKENANSNKKAKTSVAAAPDENMPKKKVASRKTSGCVDKIIGAQDPSMMSGTRAAAPGMNVHEKAAVLPKTSATASTKSGSVEGSSAFSLTTANVDAHKAAQRKSKAADTGKRQSGVSAVSQRTNVTRNTNKSSQSQVSYTGSYSARLKKEANDHIALLQGLSAIGKLSDAEKLKANKAIPKVDRRESGGSVTERAEKRRDRDAKYGPQQDRKWKAKESTEERKKAQEVRDQAEGTLNAIKDSLIFESLNQLSSCSSVKDAATRQAAVVEALDADDELFTRVQKGELRKLLSVTAASPAQLTAVNTKTAEWKARVLKGAQAALKEAQLNLKSSVDQELINNPEVRKQQFRKAATDTGLARDKPSDSVEAGSSTKASSTPATAGKRRVCSSSSAAAATNGDGDDDDQEEEEDDEEAY